MTMNMKNVGTGNVGTKMIMNPHHDTVGRAVMTMMKKNIVGTVVTTAVVKTTMMMTGMNFQIEIGKEVEKTRNIIIIIIAEK